MILERINGLEAIGRLGHDLQSFILVQKIGEPLAWPRVAVHDHHANLPVVNLPSRQMRSLPLLRGIEFLASPI